jgi:hypothetical protein
MPYKPIPEANTPAAHGALTPDQQMLILAQRQEASSRVQLTQALSRMGRFDEALAVAPEEMKPLIQAYIDAENADDGERCECIREHDVADYTRNRNAEPKLITVGKYSRRFKHWSEKYGGVVTHHVCLECGHRNTLPADVAIDFQAEAAEVKAKKFKEAYDAELAAGAEVRTDVTESELPPVPPDEPEEPEEKDATEIG